MSEMIDRVAEAILASHLSAGRAATERRLDTTQWRIVVEDARAAIQAMRDPTERMLEAGADRWSTYYPAPDQGYVNERATWRAMIDEALKEG